MQVAENAEEHFGRRGFPSGKRRIHGAKKYQTNIWRCCEERGSSGGRIGPPLRGSPALLGHREDEMHAGIEMAGLVAEHHVTTGLQIHGHRAGLSRIEIT